MTILTPADQLWTDRSRRAAELRRLHPHAEDLLALYEALIGPQRAACEAAERDRPGPDQLPAYVAGTALPGILGATLRAGPDKLRAVALARFHDADLSDLVSRWLGGGEQSVT